jgi:hypothetical protein
LRIRNLKLISKITSYGFNDLFAFTVEGLIPSLISTLVVDMAHCVIVEGLGTSTIITSLLTSSPIIARHTSMIRLSKTENGICGLKYQWAQREMRPWGHRLPPQCPVCRSFRSWGDRKDREGIALFACRGTRNGSRCSYIQSFEKPNGAERVEKSDWIKIPWP